MSHTASTTASAPEPALAKVTGKTWTVSALTMASRVLGLARDWCMVFLFGAALGGRLLDSFLLAFIIPNLFRRLFGEGALSAAFIPAFVESREKEGGEKSSQLASAVFTLLFTFTALVAVVGAVGCAGAGWAIGFSSNMGRMLGLLAVMLPFLCFICCSALMSAMLQSVKSFALPAMMSIILNLCFIGTMAYIFFGLAEGRVENVSATKHIWLLAVAVVGAGALQVFIQWPALVVKGVSLTPNFDFKNEAVMGVLKSLGPTALGLGVVQINVLVDNLIAGWISARGESGGAVQYLYLGNRLMQLPLGVFGIAIASTVFPYLAGHFANGEYKQLLSRINTAFRMIMFVVLPAAVGIAVISDPLVRLIFQRPNMAFSDGSVYRTALTLSCYALGLVFYSMQHLLTRVFYASKDFKTPVKVAVFMVGLNFVLNIVFAFVMPDVVQRWFGGGGVVAGRTMGEAGLALATSVTALVSVIVLWEIFKSKMIERIGDDKFEKYSGSVLWPFCRISIASAAMGIMVYFTISSIPYEPEFLGLLERGLVPIAVGLAIYIVMCMVVPVPEFEEFITDRKDNKLDSRSVSPGK